VIGCVVCKEVDEFFNSIRKPDAGPSEPNDYHPFHARIIYNLSFQFFARNVLGMIVFTKMKVFLSFSLQTFGIKQCA